MKSQTVSFIGGGNMGRSLIGGLVDDHWATDRIWVADADKQQLAALRRFTVHTTQSNEEAVHHADVLVLAVKPQALKSVAQQISRAVRDRQPLVVSIAAGIRLESLARWLGRKTAIVRAMPNTPALVKSAATALFANQFVSTEQRNQAESVMRSVGLTLWLDNERQMDAVTALSGSGPAYFFLIMEVMEKAGRDLGLDADTARLLTLQTAFGAAKMALESAHDSATLRTHVTSPGGTTEKAIEIMHNHQIEAIFKEALRAAYQRSIELATILAQP